MCLNKAVRKGGSESQDSVDEIRLTAHNCSFETVQYLITYFRYMRYMPMDHTMVKYRCVDFSVDFNR